LATLVKKPALPYAASSTPGGILCVKRSKKNSSSEPEIRLSTTDLVCLASRDKGGRLFSYLSLQCFKYASFIDNTCLLVDTV